MTAKRTVEESSAKTAKPKKEKRKKPPGPPPPEVGSIDVRKLSNKMLMGRLEASVAGRRKWTAFIVELLAEVERRRLHLIDGYTSMFDFCQNHLLMSEGTSFRHIAAARIARNFPQIIALIASGEIHLSALALIRNLLTPDSFDTIISAVKRKTKREVQDFIAQVAPKENVPTTITEGLNGGEQRSKLEPWNETYDLLRVMIPRSARAMFDLALNRSRRQNPSGDIGTLFLIMLEQYVKYTDKQQFKKTDRPQKNPRPKKPGTGPTDASRREAYEHGGEQCTYVSPDGRRCQARAFLSLHHVDARGKGGSDEAANLAVRCDAHNWLHAEQDYGEDYIQKRIEERREDLRQRKSGNAADAKKPTPKTLVAGEKFKAPAAGPELANAMRGKPPRARKLRTRGRPA
jgi:hypothetical protein